MQYLNLTSDIFQTRMLCIYLKTQYKYLAEQVSYQLYNAPYDYYVHGFFYQYLLCSQHMEIHQNI